MKTSKHIARSTAAIFALALGLGGCSSYSVNLPFAQYARSTDKSSIPKVQNCINVNGGTGGMTTPEYVCNGKTYTSRELHKIRQDASSSGTNSHS